MAVVELRGLASLLQQLKLRPDIAAEATARANTVEAALWKWGTVLTKDWGEVFAYEVDGALFLENFMLNLRCSVEM